MKKTVLTALSLIILLAGSSLYAQGMYGRGMGDGCGGPGTGSGMHKPFMHLDMLQYRLNLTNAQVDKIYKIDREYMDKFYQNRNNADKISELRDKHFTEIENVLTPEQKIKWKEFKDNRPARGKRMNNEGCPGFGLMGGMPGFHYQWFQKDLGLTDEQLDKIYKIQKDNLDKFYQARNDYDKVRELRTKQDAEIDGVLTAEQKTKLNELRKNRPVYDKKPGDGRDGRGHHHHSDEQ